jgi:serine phosphatase RsbU (regulator of sigma subunit)
LSFFSQQQQQATVRSPAIARFSSFLDQRPQVVRAVYLAVFIVLASYCTYHVVRFASITTDENTYIDSPRGVLITTVDPGGASDLAGLKPGDVITAVNGKPVKDTREAMEYILTGSEGKKLAYTISRDSRELVLTVVLATFGIRLFTLSLILTGIAFFFLSAFVMLQRPRNPVARLFGWATLATGVFMMVNFNYSQWYFTLFIERLNPLLMQASFTLGFGAMYHLFFRFPAPRYLAPVPWWIFAVTYSVPAVLIAGVALGVLPSKPFMMQVTAGLAFAIVEPFLYYRLRLPKNPGYSAKTKLLRAAGILAIVSVSCYPFAGRNASWQGLFMLQLAVPALIFAAIVQQRLFDLYVVVRRTSLYRASVATLNLATILVFAWCVIALSGTHWNIPVPTLSGTSFQFRELSSFPGPERAAIERRLMILSALAITLLLWKGRARVRGVLDVKFYRGEYDYRRALTAFSKLSLRFSEPRELAQAVVTDLTEIMHLRGAAFARRVNGRLIVDAASNLRFPPEGAPMLEAGSPWCAALEQKGGAEAVDNLDARAQFAETGVEFIAPVYVDSRMAAVLLLGEKLAGTNFSKDDVELLGNLSINVADAIMTMNFYEGAKEQERMRRELEIARRIQLSALPEELPDFPGLDVSASSLPAYEVGGDFYDFLGHHNAITFLVGDVSGKGTSAALYLSRAQGIVRAIDSYGPSLWELLVRLNTQIFDHLDRQAFLTLSALRVSLLDDTITYLRAGHLPLLHYRAADGGVLEHKPKGIGIGLDAAAFATHLEEVALRREAGDIFLLVSDGISEAADGSGQQFGMERLSAVLHAHAAHSAREIKDAVVGAAQTFSAGLEQLDDMTVLVVKIL